ncbi:DUF937 domain-containing protein [Arvimicrobium flavum]|uniref:DUF937 domain-containing protein n=1 Tax=Arvimicrobium flavum TaxID=3393320 RepID=UPI00237A76C1|nr:DUF937 domain-containing protein [Mesorhizobium shangrilense]
MPNLFDMLNQSQNGQGMEMLARQFGLSQQQVQQAVEALLPAFSQGLKRNAADPYGIGGFLTALASGQHSRYFDDASAAFSPQGMAEGNGILGHLFGSKDLSRAVASQAAQATGIGQDVMKQMLPALASMIMGGMFKQSTNQMQAGGFEGGSNPLRDIIEQMMQQGGGSTAGGQQPRQQAPQPSNPFDNPFGKVLQDMFGGGAQSQAPETRAQPRQQQPGPFGDNPWGKVLEEMMRGGGQAQPAPQPQPAPRQRQQANPSGRQKNPYDDIFGDMFETGRQQRDEYQKGVESIFDQFTRGMDRHR